MKQLHIRIDNELHADLVKRAKKSGRSLHSEIVNSLQEIVRVPVVGKIMADGTVQFDWDSPEGMKEAAERG
jgi:hypothetical protein